MNTEQTRLLAAAIAPLLPGEWSAQWEDYTIGAYLVSGNLKIFLSAQTGWGARPGMVRVSAQLPFHPDIGEREENKVSSIYIGEHRNPEAFAREINRRILIAQDYAVKVARQQAAINAYAKAEDDARAVALALGSVLEVAPRGDTEIRAYPYGTWRASSNSVHLNIHLPVQVAFKIAKILKEEI